MKVKHLLGAYNLLSNIDCASFKGDDVNAILLNWIELKKVVDEFNNNIKEIADILTPKVDNWQELAQAFDNSSAEDKQKEEYAIVREYIMKRIQLTMELEDKEKEVSLKPINVETLLTACKDKGMAVDVVMLSQLKDIGMI